MNGFTVGVTLPSGKEARISEIKNQDYITILKYCENVDGEGFNSFFFENIYQHLYDLDILDKFYILLAGRMLFIDPDLSFTTADNKRIVIPIQSILTKIDHFEGDFTSTYTFDNIVLELGLPSSLFLKTVDDIYVGCIKSITVNEKNVNFSTLSSHEKNTILSRLPGSVFNLVLQHTKKISDLLSDFIIIERDNSLNVEEININLLSNGLISFVLSVYSSNLVDFFELIYTFASRLHISQEAFFNMTPLDSRIMLNIYNKDIEEREKELKKQEEM